LKKIVFQLNKESGGEGKIRLLLTPVVEAPATTSSSDTGLARKKTSRHFVTQSRLESANMPALLEAIEGEIAELEKGVQYLRLPLALKAEEESDALTLGLEREKKQEDPSLPSHVFNRAKIRYLNFKGERIKHMLPPELKEELVALDKLSSMTLERAASESRKTFEEVVLLLVSGLKKQVLDPEKFFTREMTIRDATDKTGLRVSEIVKRLGIPVLVAKRRSSSDMKMLVIHTSNKTKKKKPLFQILAQVPHAPQELLFLRLITWDPAGNAVEQLVVDRLSRLQHYAHTLGSSASFEKFLFNARRAFDRYSREIIFDEMVLDPQFRGYGKRFYRAQMQAFAEAGFVDPKTKKGVRIREDTVSCVTLGWMQGAHIDWERLAARDADTARFCPGTSHGFYFQRDRGRVWFRGFDRHHCVIWFSSSLRF